MKTYVHSKGGVIAEHELTTSDVNHKKEQHLRILYTILGVGIVLVVVSLLFLLMQ